MATNYVQQPINTQVSSPPKCGETYSGVSINIFNPSASPNGTSVGNVYPMPMYPQSPMNSTQTNTYNSSYVPQNVQNAYPNSNQAASTPIANTPAQEEKPQKEIVKLTDDYIKSLETYFRSEDKQQRMLGVSELAKRFEEEKSRKSDPALCSLLNLALQDPDSNVRSVGLAILSSGYSSGDTMTKQILTNMKSKKTEDGQDEAMAAEALFKSSEQSIKVNDNSHAPVEKPAEKK